MGEGHHGRLLYYFMNSGDNIGSYASYRPDSPKVLNPVPKMLIDPEPYTVGGMLRTDIPYMLDDGIPQSVIRNLGVSIAVAQKLSATLIWYLSFGLVPRSVSEQ